MTGPGDVHRPAPSGVLVPAAGVLTSTAADRRVVYDPAARQIMVLNATASLIWDICRQGAAVDEVSATLRAHLADEPPDLDAQVRRFLDDLRENGLIGDRALPEPDLTGRWEPVEPGPLDGGSIPVLDGRVALSGGSLALLDEITALFPPAEAAWPLRGSLVVRVDVEGDAAEATGWGGPRRIARHRFADVFVGVLNQVASSSDRMLVLHAAGLRSPDGRVVLLAADSGSGKSTLAAQLVSAGWDYLGDEAIGVRPVDGRLIAVGYPKPVSLRTGGLAAVGLASGEDRLVRADVLRADVELVAGEAGPVAAVVLVDFDPERSLVAERLGFDDAVAALGEASFNLARAGQVALDTVVELALGVPVVRLGHRGGDEAVAAVEELVGG